MEEFLKYSLLFIFKLFFTQLIEKVPPKPPNCSNIKLFLIPKTSHRGKDTSHQNRAFYYEIG